MHILHVNDTQVSMSKVLVLLKLWCVRLRRLRTIASMYCMFCRYQLSEEDVLCQVQHALKLVSMEAYQNRPTHTLSGGQKQRVAIAGALAESPKASAAV